MMLIKTVVRPSMIPDAGLGCFSVDFVPKDSLLWQFNPNFDRAYTQAELDRLELPAREFIDFYGYKCEGIYYLSCDHTHFINHSDQPSMYSDETGFLAYAAKDIYPGEEIVDDYRNLGVTEADDDFNLRWLRTVL
jgi:SET domain-containing protein